MDNVIRNISAILVAIILYSCSAPSEKKNTNPVTGLWKLYTITSQDSTGKWVQANWMKNGQGLLQYDSDQTMSVHFTPKNYGKYDSLKAYWYVAKYKLNKKKSFIEHQRILHSDPDEIGKTVKRFYKLKGDTLVMNAKEFGFQLKWIKQ